MGVEALLKAWRYINRLSPRNRPKAKVVVVKGEEYVVVERRELEAEHRAEIACIVNLADISC
jgi:hypothetical protein